MGPAQSARGIQLGGSGAAARWRRIPSRDLSPAHGRPPPGAFPPRGGAPRPALGRPGRDRGRRWLVALAPRALQRPISPTSPLPGAVDQVLAAPSPSPSRPAVSAVPLSGGAAAGGRAARVQRGDGAPRSRRDCTDRGGLSSVRSRPRRVARAGTGPRPEIEGARGLRRCRQPTRPVLKHGPRSLTRARVRGCTAKPRGAMKVRAGVTPAEVGSRGRVLVALSLSRGGGKSAGSARPGAPPARLARSVGEVEHERAR